MPHLQETLTQKQAGLKAAQDQLAEVVAKVRPDGQFLVVSETARFAVLSLSVEQFVQLAADSTTVSKDSPLTVAPFTGAALDSPFPRQ